MISKIKTCFNKDRVNLGRQTELDIAKGIAIIFMVFCHAFEMLCWFFNPEISTDFAYVLLDVILGGSFAAPVFIFCMGISFAYSRRTSAGDMFKRALKMAGIVLIFEIARTALPGLLQWVISGDPECIEYVYMFFNVDILQFVTLALLVIALFKKLKLKPLVMVIIAVICSVIGQLLQGVSTGSYIGDIVAGFLWNSNEYAYFPLLNWLIFPVCGYAFSGIWQRLQDKEKFFRIVTPVSWVISIVYFASMAFFGEYYLSGGEYYGLGILDAVFALIICFSMIGLGYYLTKWGGRISNWLSSMGSRVTSFYCIHWTIYYYLYVFLFCFLEDYISQWLIIPVSILIIAASDLLSKAYKNKKFKNKV